MPDLTRIEKWVNQIGVDYYSYFIRAWIPFNAWYRENYSQIDSDRAIINQIKRTGNRFKDTIVQLLDGNDEQSNSFRVEISKLHNSLNRGLVPCRQIYHSTYNISFREICVENNPNLYVDQTETSNKILYYVRCYENPAPSAPKYVITVKNSSGSIFVCTDMPEYNKEIFKGKVDQSNLTAYQKVKIMSLYDRINPWYPVNLLFDPTRDEDQNKIVCGEIYFTSDRHLLAKGIIETLYLLRNSLMHGELNPTKESMQTYKSAYNVLSEIVSKLV